MALGIIDVELDTAFASLVSEDDLSVDIYEVAMIGVDRWDNAEAMLRNNWCQSLTGVGRIASELVLAPGRDGRR